MGKYRKENKQKKHAAFSFSEVAKEELFRDILNVDVSKGCFKMPMFLPMSLRRTQTSLPVFYTLLLTLIFLFVSLNQ